VYGGGGITPDVFIPLDTSYLNQDYLRLRGGAVAQFIYRYAENHADDLNEITLEKLRNEFVVDEMMLKEFLDYAAANGVEVAPEDFEKIKSDVKLLLKSRLARHLFKEDGFYTIWNDKDEAVKAAMRALKKENPLADFDK